MKRSTPNRLAFGTLAALMLVGIASTALAASTPTPTPTAATINTRVFNDCPSSSLTTVNNYPSLISFHDSNLDCFGFANLHTWTLSEDGTNEGVFDNNSSYRIATDFKIEGSGNGEGGIRVSPWFSHYVDGLFNVRSTDGEIACFGGRLPFYSFSNAPHLLRYVKGTTIHLELIYEPRALNATRPATIEYRIGYNGNTYSSGVLPFDEGNVSEGPLHGLWGMLNDGRVGGHFKAFLGQGNPVDVKASFANVSFTTTPVPTSAVTKERVFNDCPSSTLVTTNNYPALISFADSNLDCFGFANLHIWRYSENGTDAAIFNNNASFRIGTDFKIDGSGNGEGGLQVSPWFSKDVDGLFNVRSTDGEIACFGGRLPFYSFSNAPHVLRYVKGTTIHLELVYTPNGRTAASPATVEYRISYNGNDYSSGVLPFDGANPAEDPPYGVYGMLNDGQAGGHFKAFLGQGNPVNVTGTFTNITFSTCLQPAEVAFQIKPNKLNTNSNGPWVTAYITPGGNIDVASLELNGVPAATDPAPTLQGGTLKVRFNRASILATVTPPEGTLLLTGEAGGQCIETSSTIEVKGKVVQSPGQGVVLPAGSVTDVLWEADPGAGSAKLLASADNGINWAVVVENLPNTGSYRWIVPNMPSPAARVAVASVYEQDETGVITEAEYAVSGAFTISSPLGVGGGSSAFSLRAPNPVSGPLNVTFSLASNQAAELAVFDIAGRSLVSRQVGGQTGSQSVTLGRLPAGLYVVRLSQGGRSLSNRVTVVQ